MDFTIGHESGGVTDVIAPAVSSQPSAFSLTPLHLSSRAPSPVIPSEARDLGFRAATNSEREHKPILHRFKLRADS